MKLLFDQNLSFRLCGLLSDLFPDSAQLRPLGLDQADDRVIWEFAKANEFTLVTQDSDYADFAILYGPPPKVIWLRCGNQPTREIEILIRSRFDQIKAFEMNPSAGCLELF